jgi:hypothetical protein
MKTGELWFAEGYLKITTFGDFERTREPVGMVFASRHHFSG